MVAGKILVRLAFSIGLLLLLYATLGILVRHTGCAHLSEDEIIRFAQSRIQKEIRFLVRHFKEPVTEVLSGRFVLLSLLDSRFSPGSPFAVMYQTAGGQLVQMEIGLSCRVRWSYPHAIVPPEESIFSRDLRTGQRFVMRSTVAGVSSEPGTEASHFGAIQLPDESIRP